MAEINSKYVSLGTPVRIQLVEEAIGRAANVTLEQMRSHQRDKEYAEARMAVWYICHDHLGFSFVELARVYQRDHTTIISGVRKMRSGKASEQILDGIKKAQPELFEQRKKGEARTVENWRF